MKTISFFSYKGGAGRSTLAYNVIPLLAKDYLHPTAESPIIVVDTDVDSCGMSYLLKAENSVTETNCIQYLLGGNVKFEKCNSIEDHEFFRQLIPVGNAYGYADDRAILLLPAKDNRNINEESGSNYSERGGDSFELHLDSFLQMCDECFDIPAVIFDSSVGNTALANVSNQVSDIIVCAMRPTTQFVNGTYRYFRGVEGFDNEHKTIGRGKHIVLVPNVIPQNTVTIGNTIYPGAAIDRICNAFVRSKEFRTEDNGVESIIDSTYHFDMLDVEEFGIPAVDSFMWAEGLLHNKKDRNDNENEVLKRYNKLAEIINSIEED